MLVGILIALVVLWLLGFVNLPFIPFLNIALFDINNHPITLLNVIIFLLIASLLELLPSPLNIIAGVILVLWVLSILGIIAIGGLSQILVLAVIIGLVIAVLGIV